MQIHIKEFDQLGEKDFRAGQMNLGKISSGIINKCPVLSAASSAEKLNFEDIQLHLLYLINRRQTSLVSRNQELNNYNVAQYRPASSASIRSGSLQSGSRSSRLHNGVYGKQQQSSCRQSNDSESAADIYSFVRALEQRDRACCFDLERFEQQFDEHLDSIEFSNRDVTSQIDNLLSRPSSTDTKLDNYLEGLYGDRTERFLSLAIIRRLCCGKTGDNNQSRMVDIGSNRLLICAIIRILRDSSLDEYCAREFILCCLIRITSYADIYLESFETNSDQNNSGSYIDLVKILGDLLKEHIKNENRSAVGNQVQEEPCSATLNSNHNYLCAILVVLINLFKINKDASIMMRLEERILSTSSTQDPSNCLGATLCELFQLNARDLMREIRLMGKPAKVVQLLSANILLMRQMSCSRDFIQRIRIKNQFFESVVTLLNCLQLSRPGSGNPAASLESTYLIRDRQTLNELYHLELNLMMLVNNLLMDSRIRTKFIKRKLLKPVLRNLVIFLAAATTTLASGGTGPSSSWLDISGSNDNDNNSTYMDSCGWSLILMAPFRSLYELSCDKSVRLELYRSNIIMKCLLEYLLSVIGRRELFDFVRRKSSSTIRANNGQSSSLSSDWIDGAIQVEPIHVSHYILSVWINLSSQREAPIYKQDQSEELELRDLLCEYMDIVLDKLCSLMISLFGGQNDLDTGSTRPMDQQDYNLIYLHMKLLRNVSQFMRFNQEEELEFYKRCVDRFSRMADLLFDTLSSSASSGRRRQLLLRTTNRRNLKPFLVECLASLSNFIGSRESSPADYAAHKLDGSGGEEDKNHHLLASIYSKLFQLKCEDFADEEDDDLLLVSIQLIGFLANKREICHWTLNGGGSSSSSIETINQEATADNHQGHQQLGQRINVKILRACNFVLDSKLSDYQMIIHTLYSLSQLMNHSQFLKTLLVGLNNNDYDHDHDDDDDDVLASNSTTRGLTNCEPIDATGQESNLNLLAETLVDKLANLVLHTGGGGRFEQAEPQVAGGQQKLRRRLSSQGAVPRLALRLLDLFRQLEQQTSIESSFVHKIRFAYYNTKWLAAIQASREALESPASAPTAAAPRPSSGATARSMARDRTAPLDAASWFGGELSHYEGDGDEDDEFGDIRGKRLLDGQQLRLQPMMEEEEAAGEHAEAGGDVEDEDRELKEDLESGGSTASGSFGEAPDLNVIDCNSMIKHLSSRRQLRRMKN